MGILKKLFAKDKNSLSVHDQQKHSAENRSKGQQNAGTKIKVNSRKCDKCNKLLSSPEGYLLDASDEGLATWNKLTNLTNSLHNTGASFVTPQSDPFWFLCENCITNAESTQSIILDKTTKIMASMRAEYFWDTGEWERPMLPDDFPIESCENQLPWMSPALEAKWKAHIGPNPTLKDFLIIRAELLARSLLQTPRQSSYTKNPLVSNSMNNAVIIYEMDADNNWEDCLRGIVERYLIANVSAETKLFFIPYRNAAEIWFSYRMLPYVVSSIAVNLNLNLDKHKYLCKIDNKGRRYLIILG